MVELVLRKTAFFHFFYSFAELSDSVRIALIHRYIYPYMGAHFTITIYGTITLEHVVEKKDI